MTPTIDCKSIETRLVKISKEAQGAQKLLGKGNTGRDFDLALKVILLHAKAIRHEVYGD